MAATDTTPNTQASDGKNRARKSRGDMSKYAVTTPQFNEYCKDMGRQFDNLVRYVEMFYDVPKGASILVDDTPMTRNDLKTMKNAFKAQFHELPRFHAEARRSRRDPYVRDDAGEIIYDMDDEGNKQPRYKSYNNNGFRNPMFVSRNMRDFFRDANIGTVDPNNPKSSKLNETLTLLTDPNEDFAGYGVTSSALLTPLFSIYAYLNNLTKLARVNQNLPEDQWNRQWLGVDDRMEKYFGELLTVLENQPQGFNKKRKPLPKFDRHNFRYADFQKIVAINRRNKEGKLTKYKNIDTPAGPAVSEDEDGILNDETVRNALDKEQEKVSENLETYRARNEPFNKALRARQRKSKKDGEGKPKAPRQSKQVPKIVKPEKKSKKAKKGEKTKKVKKEKDSKESKDASPKGDSKGDSKGEAKTEVKSEVKPEAKAEIKKETPKEVAKESKPAPAPKEAVKETPKETPKEAPKEPAKEAPRKVAPKKTGK